jgi:hypothetical protein
VAADKPASVMKVPDTEHTTVIVRRNGCMCHPNPLVQLLLSVNRTNGEGIIGKAGKQPKRLDMLETF